MNNIQRWCLITVFIGGVIYARLRNVKAIIKEQFIFPRRRFYLYV